MEQPAGMRPWSAWTALRDSWTRCATPCALGTTAHARSAPIWPGCRRFIYFHHVRHPAEMGEAEINAFLTHLAVAEKVSASTQNQALAALLFLYRHVLDARGGRSWREWSGPGAAPPCPW